ncbi:uncharacterized protein LOC144113843 isoform X2 [Amblyomma americanum]
MLPSSTKGSTRHSSGNSLLAEYSQTQVRVAKISSHLTQIMPHRHLRLLVSQEDQVVCFLKTTVIHVRQLWSKFSGSSS